VIAEGTFAVPVFYMPESAGRFYDKLERDRQHALRRIQRRRARSVASWAIVPLLIAVAVIILAIFCT
jgi:hypothetical protein